MDGIAKDSFKPIIHVFLICGIHKVKDNWPLLIKIFYSIWRYFNVCVSFLGIMQSFLYVMTVEKFDLVDCSSPILNTGLYIGMVDEATNLIAIVQKDFMFKVATPYGEEPMKYYYSTMYKFVIFWQIYLPVVGFLMIVSPIFNIYRMGERELPAQSYSPYEWSKSPYWELTLFQQVFMQTMLGVIYTNSDTFFFSMMYLTCGQFPLLNEKLKNIVYMSLINCGVDKTKVQRFSDFFNEGTDNLTESWNEDDERSAIVEEVSAVIDSKEFDDHFKRELRECVQMHRFLNEFLNKVQDFLSPCLFPIVFFTTSYLIFVSYNFINNSDGMVISLLTQIFALLFQLIIFTYFGQQLTNEYEKLYANFYDSPWYLCNNGCKKILLIMQISLLKSATFSVGRMIVFNLPTLVNVSDLRLTNFLKDYFVLFIILCWLLRSYMSYLAVLRTLDN